MVNQSSIHVLDFEDNIIDYFDSTDYAIIEAEHERDISSIFERFDFKVLSERAENLKNRVRIITYDSQDNPIEFIITKISEGIDGYVDVESNASFLEDMIGAEPFDPGSLKGYTSHQFLDEILADTGWERSPDSVFSGGKTVTWSDINDRIKMAKLGQTRYDLRLDREIILGRNRVEKRYIKYVDKTPEFYGAEITYGDNMLNLERTIDYSNIVTRMIGYGPQDEDGNRVRVVIDDREAQMQFGLKPIYGVHEINSEDTEMTEKRATTLTTNQLKKQNEEAFSYEISSIDRNGTIGELIRVKNLDFNPVFYADVQAVKEVYHPLTNTSTFTYSFIKEYREDEISRNVLEKMREVAESVTKNLNIDGISETIKTDIKDLYEVKIPRQDKPPFNPEDGDLWLDTTNPERNILMKYDKELGQWVKTSPTEAHEVGAISKEEAFHSELKILLEGSLLPHTNLINTAEEALSNEYLVDIFAKNDLQLLLDKTISQFGLFRQSVEDVDIDRVNYHELADIYRMYEDYKVTVFELTELLKKVNKLIDERFRLLQSQYSEEKYLELLETVADSIGGVITDSGEIDVSESLRKRLDDSMNIVARAIGGSWDGNQLHADLPNQKDLNNLNQSLRAYFSGQVDALDNKLGKQIETVVNQAKNEFSVAVNSVEKKIDDIKIGGRNLLENTDMCTNNKVDITNYNKNLPDKLKPDTEYTFSLDVEVNNPTRTGAYLIGNLRIIYEDNSSQSVILSLLTLYDDVSERIFRTFKTKDKRISHIQEIYFGTELTAGDSQQFCNPKLEKGNIATDWTPAPEDVQDDINNLNTEITKQSTSLNILENKINLKADSETVKQMLNAELQPIKSNVQTNKAELEVLSNQISSKVDSVEYEKDKNGLINDIKINNSEIKQAADSLKSQINSVDRKIDGIKIGGRNLLENTDLCTTGRQYITDYNKNLLDKLKTDTKYIFSLDVEIKNLHEDTNSITVGELILDMGFFTLPFRLQLPKTLSGEDINERIYMILEINGYKEFFNGFETISFGTDKVLGDSQQFCNPKLEKGTVATDWTPAPEDLTNSLDEITQSVTENTSSIDLLKDEINLKVTNSEVTQQLNSALEPIKSSVQTNQAQFDILKNQISSKVESSKYTTDMQGIARDISTAKSDITQLSDNFNVTIKGVERKIDEKENEGKNLLKDSGRYVKSSEHLMNRYYLNDELKFGEEVTLQIKGKPRTQNMVWGAAEKVGYMYSNSIPNSNTNNLFNNPYDKPRNLVLNSEYRDDFTNNDGDYSRIKYDVVQELEAGKTYTLSFDIEGDVRNIDNITAGLSSEEGYLLGGFMNREGNHFYGAIENDKYTRISVNVYKGEFGNTSKNANKDIRIKNMSVVEGSNYYPNQWSPAWEEDAPVFTHKFYWKSSISSGEQFLDIYQDESGLGESEIFWVKLERGSKATPYFKHPEDAESILTQHTSEINQTKEEISQRVSYEQFNHSNKTLEKFFTELSQTGTGLSFKIDDNGTIQGFDFNKNQFTIDSNLININSGDVTIRNGVTTITTAMINKLSSNTAFINNLTGNTAFINKIKTYDLTANQVQVGFNKVNSNVSITSGGLTTYSGGTISSELSGTGHRFYHNGTYVGQIGTGQITGYPNVRGLRFNLSDYGQYMAFSYRTGNLNPGDPNEVAMLWSKGAGSYVRGFHFNEDVMIKNDKELETRYIRPRFATGGARLYLNQGTFDNTQNGVFIRYSNVNNGGIHMSTETVSLVARRGNSGAFADFRVSEDNTGGRVYSMAVYNRTYSGAPNMYITSVQTLGRSVSAKKYKVSIEKQFKDEDKQLAHSKQILKLSPKTWFDKTETEIVAKELETGEKQSDDEFTLKRHFGMIADEFDEIGLKELVQYDDNTGEVEGLAYDRIPVHLIVLIKDLYKQIDELKEKINNE